MKLATTRTDLPKMSLLRLSLYISEWFLLAEDSESWIDDPKILFVWHLLFFTVLAVALGVVVPHLWLQSVLASSVGRNAHLPKLSTRRLGSLDPDLLSLGGAFLQTSSTN